MVKIKFICILFFISIASILPQTTYYVSSSQGNDLNSGTSENSPYKTINKINSLDLSPGDKVLFKCNDIWQGEILTIKNSGVSTDKISFGSYGSGDKPILTLKQKLPEWNSTSKWNYIGNGVWRYQFIKYSTGNPVQRLWLNGYEVNFAFKGGSDADGNPTKNADGTVGLNENYPFYPAYQYLDIYTNSADYPFNTYSSIEYAGGNPEAGKDYTSINIW